jgi:hypothetical protein
LQPHIEPQGIFLTKILASTDAKNLPASPGSAEWSQWCRHFQTLTHPEHLGHRFQAFTCQKTA